MDIVTDVVINEIMYSSIFDEGEREFVELYNRGANAIDLTGWRFSKGIDFDFADGTIIPAGGYIVVAKDPEWVRSTYDLGAEVVGPETPDAIAAFGGLRNSGERVSLKDQIGRVVDTVRYYDGGQWPRWADGLGSSLELIDPNQDNRHGQAWDASDDSDKAVVDEIAYVGRHGGGESELHVILTTRGITVLDDISVLNGATEQVVNPTFNSSTNGWMIEGTHVRSGRTSQNPISGSGSLKVIASGRGDNKVNRIETSNTGMRTLPTGRNLDISFKARWVVGSPTMVTHGYEHAMAKSHKLSVPEDLGTPGRINSVTQRLIDATGDSNLGPVITDVFHSPVVPAANQDVTVRARVVDPDGIGTVRVRYTTTGNPSSSPTSITMSAIGDNVYEATIPGRADGTMVVFYVDATDDDGRDGRYPADIEERTHPLVRNPSNASINDQRYLLYKHDVQSIESRFHGYRFLMTNSDEARVSNRRRQSNDLVNGSFIYGSNRIYYEAATRFSGSPFARGGWGGSFRVVMPRDDLLHGWIRKFNIDNHHGSGTSAKERISHYLIRQQQSASTSVPYAAVQTMARWKVNNRSASVLEHSWVPDTQYLDLWYPKDGDGAFFEIDDRFVIDDNGNRAGSTDARLLYPPPSSRSDGNGANQENYRWFFGLRANNGSDDFSRLQEFARIMDPARTSSTNFDRVIFDVANVEEMLRIWAVRWNTDDWDTWGAGRGKNAYLFRPEIDARWNLMAWDTELTYGNTGSFNIPTSPTSTFSPGGFAEVNRMANRPAIKRIYYGILSEMVNGAENGKEAWFHSDYLAPFATRLAAFGMSSTGIAQPGGFIDQRNAIIKSRISTVVYPRVQLTISTNSGNDIATAEPTIDLTGTAPVDVQVITVAGESYETRFTSMTRWRVDDIPLLAGANELLVAGFNLHGDLIDIDTITVTTTNDWVEPAVTGITPEEGLEGDTVTITGTDFHNGIKVFFAGVRSPNVTFDENGPTPGQLEAEVPPGVEGPAAVTVENLDGQVSPAMTFTYLPPPPTFVRGDVNDDGSVNVADPLKLLVHLFQGVDINCRDAADLNDDGDVNVTDAMYGLAFLFQGGAAPSAPFPSADEDPTEDAEGCERSS